MCAAQEIPFGALIIIPGWMGINVFDFALFRTRRVELSIGLMVNETSMS